LRKPKPPIKRVSALEEKEEEEEEEEEEWLAINRPNYRNVRGDDL